MLKLLKLLMPAIVPSWNFFDVIAPSPRVQFTLLAGEHESPEYWQDFRPRPERISFLQMLGRLLWNAKWNESLYVVSCAERLMEQVTQHSKHEILDRILADLDLNHLTKDQEKATHLQFRLLLIERQGVNLQQGVIFYSPVHRLSKEHEL